ncbi:MAG: AMP-binding protein [Rhizobiales bacterium]|nr:AMP-binding protein [Hyphomicrobiales bacterium]
MTEYYDDLETRSADQREAALFSTLPDLIAHAQAKASGWAKHLDGVDPKSVADRAGLAKLPVFRKSMMGELQKANPPFGGFATIPVEDFTRIFMSPGPIWEPQRAGTDPWNGARPLFAAGFRKGDLVHNSLAYHMTPGGFIYDTAFLELGCTLFPAGIGNTEMQVAAISALKPSGYAGTPDYLKVIMDHASEAGLDISSLKRASVGGGALPESLRAWYGEHGVAATQTYATAELGVIAFETEALEGMVINENYIVEIVKPGTGDLVVDSDVGEMVVTILDRTYPLIRFATGDLTAILPGDSPCGRTNMRIKGWMGRADQRTKVKGMFIDPAQINDIAKRHPEFSKLRLVVDRANDQDVMVLKAECANANDDMAEKLAASVQAICKVRGDVEIVEIGSLPNDGKVIADERSYE